MGTSNAYGGSPGWSGVQQDAQEWLDSLEGDGPGDAGDGQPPGEDEPLDDEQPGETDQSAPDELMSSGLAKVLAGVAGKLRAAIDASSRGSGSSAGGGHRVSGGGGRGRRGAAAVSGGAALASVYGVSSGNPAALAGLPLSLDELRGLSPFEQMQRIVDTATDIGAFIEDEELRVVNARVVVWALNEEGEINPTELVRRWVSEFVFQAWLTEVGSVLRNGDYDGRATREREQEVRATIAATARTVEVPDAGLRAADFTTAITDLLGAISRIFEEQAA